MKNLKVLALSLLMVTGLAGCGGNGGEDDPTPTPPPAPVVTFTELQLDLDDVTTVFTKDGEFDYEGLGVTACYSDGSSTEITAFDVTAPDMSTTGEDKEVVVTCIVDGEEKTTSYTIDVTYWTAQDLAILMDESNTLFCSETQEPLPFLAGMSVKSDETGWWIELPNAKPSDANKYAMALERINVTKELTYDDETTEVTFAMSGSSIGKTTAEKFGLDPETVFATIMIPTYMDGEYAARYYVADEMFIGGIEVESGSLVVFNHFVDASIESYFGLTDNFDTLLSGSGYKGGMGEYFDDIFTTYISKYSRLCSGLIPTLAMNSDGFFGPTNFKTALPFDEEIQSYDIAINFDIEKPSEGLRTSFINGLLANGFEVTGDPHESRFITEVLFTSYTIDSKFLGQWKVEVSDVYNDDAGAPLGYFIEVYFKAPSSEYKNYTRIEMWAIDNLLKALDLDENDVTINNQEAILNKISFTSTLDKNSGDAILEVAESFKQKLQNAGFEVTMPTQSGSAYIVTASEGMYEAKLSFTPDVETTKFIFSGIVGLPTSNIPQDLTAESLTKMLASSMLDIEEANLVEGEEGDYIDEGDGTYSFYVGLTTPVSATLFSWESWSDLDTPLMALINTKLPDFCYILQGPTHADDGSGTSVYALTNDGEYAIVFQGSAYYTDSRKSKVQFGVYIFVGLTSDLLTFN